MTPTSRSCLCISIFSGTFFGFSPVSFFLVYNFHCFVYLYNFWGLVSCRLPLLILQLALILGVSRLLHFLLKPLHQPRVVAEIAVSTKPLEKQSIAFKKKSFPPDKLECTSRKESYWGQDREHKSRYIQKKEKREQNNEQVSRFSPRQLYCPSDSLEKKSKKK